MLVGWLLSFLYIICHVELKSQKNGYFGKKKKMENCKDGDLGCIGYVNWKIQKKKKKVCSYGYDMCTLRSKK